LKICEVGIYVHLCINRLRALGLQCPVYLDHVIRIRARAENDVSSHKIY
jgi:hypothetical protein